MRFWRILLPARGRRHVHEVLAHLVASNRVIGHQDEVGTDGAVPLGGNLAVDKPVVDAGE